MTRTRRRGSREDTEQALVAAAASLVGERPWDTISGRDIAERAGVNYGLIHQYFGSKDAVLREGLNHLNRTFMSSEHAKEILDDFCRGQVDSFSSLEDQHFFRALAFTALAGRLDDLEGSVGAVRAVVQRVIDMRGADTVDARTDVAFGLSLLLGWALCEDAMIKRLELPDTSRADFDAVQAQLLTDVLFDRRDGG